jgi:hypothetical protein
MKLVELLAKELAEWPEGCRESEQDNDGEIRFTGGCGIGHDFFSELATDHATAIVTREMWEAERDKRAAIQVGIDAAEAGHTTPIADVKARYEHDNEGDGFSCEEYDPQLVSAAMIGAAIFAYSNPVKWRDRIREIDADFKIMAAERDRLVGELAAEGFALIAAAADPVEDMTDWRNWKAGDLIDVIGSGFDDALPGQRLRVEFVEHPNGQDQPVKLKAITDGYHWPEIKAGNFNLLRWHSRPSA